MRVADDYGLSPMINSAIENLFGEGKLRGASVMVLPGTRATLEKCALRSGENPGGIKLGLHLVLTNHALFTSARPQTFAAVFARSMARRLNAEQVHEEFGRQWDLFTDIFGRAPDYVDGHQFVHQLPLIRDAVVGLAAGQQNPPVVRVYDQPLPFRRTVMSRRPRAGLNVESKIIFGRALKRACLARGIPTNRYLFSLEDGVGSDYPSRLANLERYYDPAVDMIYFHPSLDGDDPFLPAREKIASRGADFNFLRASGPSA